MTCPCSKGPNRTPCLQPSVCGLCWKYLCTEGFNRVWGGTGVLPDCPPNPSPPPAVGMVQRLGNATAAAGRVVTNLVRGQQPIVSPAEQERRLAICHRCPSGLWNGLTCGACGCMGKWKAWLATEDCPRDHWGKPAQAVPSISSAIP